MQRNDDLLMQVNACHEIIQKQQKTIDSLKEKYDLIADNLLILYNIMNISEEGVAITNRYFQAIDILKSQKKIRGLASIARECEQNRWNLVTLRNNPARVMKPELLAHLVRVYNISAEWLLLGKLPIFKE